MDLMPILSTLRRHKTAAALIVLEIALSCAIVSNALHLISQRMDSLQQQSGLVEAELLALDVAGITRSEDADATSVRDLQALRALPGVRGAALVNQVPYGNNSSYSGVSTQPGEAVAKEEAATYIVGETALEVMGLRLLEGRDFLPQEYQLQSKVEHDPEMAVPAAIINRALAQKLFPGQSALGKAIYIFGDKPQTVVGVVERLQPPHPKSGTALKEQAAFLIPVRPSFASGSYLLRVDPARRSELLKQAVGTIEQVDGRRIINRKQTLSEMREAYFAPDKAMVGLLAGVCVALLVVTAFGIVGLASFWVQQRSRMIGTRRALGATRGQILRYFQTENLLLSLLGIALGMLGAYALSLLLMQSYEMPRLPWSYLPIGAALLILLGQLAVLAPARRAAALPPVAALRM
ncbi:putative ABC transport system permease protein [Paucibacter oligotrophus]|uniref:Putative ABC transport system permease protein n=1 Tax=Roseateles oligotrophus TaxID=1769250 RepID=A0A840L196_9BURK|nr:FtsX-like permease family protein [Roseateles oligotrophus]MBB4842020.1 putative ABC transport system permease protein [Roseateles oligotrophus]